MLGSNPQGVIRKDVLKKNISYFWANVKWNNEKNKILSATEPKVPASGAVAFQKALDEKYLKAVSKGDMETAQKMVDQAAKRAMPNSVLVDSEGNLIKMYHGSPETFNVFKGKEMGSTGNYFSPWKAFAVIYEKKKDFS